jgi:prepilin-type N-terminal cleavage/methylation domain-containing protein
MMPLHSIKLCKRQSGFSLMEMAVVLMILGTLMGGVLVAVSQTTENNRRSAAMAQLHQIEDALYGYVQTFERLPCPATNTSFGRQAPDTLTGNCTTTHGFIPAATLNLFGPINADGLLLDPWQNPVRYSIASRDYNGNGNFDFANAVDLTALFTTPTLVTAGIANMLSICDSANCAGTVISNLVPALVYNMGADWATFTSADEVENAEGTLGIYAIATDNQFVSTDYAEDLFDDQLIWLSPYVLFNRMISAGRLP